MRPLKFHGHPLNNIISKLLSALVVALAFPGLSCQADEQQADQGYRWHLTGDLGVGQDFTPSAARSATAPAQPVPYINAEYGRLFGRIDTFGVKVTPVGEGDLELVTRVLEDGYTPASSFGNLSKRQSSVPVGIGTLQTTTVGAVLVNLYHDLGKSGGNLADLLFAEEIDTKYVALYPQIGAEYRSRDYVKYYYGLSGAEAAQLRTVGYTPGSVTNLFIDLFLEIKVSGNWYVNANLRKTWLAKSITASPLANRHSVDAGLLALSYRFD